MLFRFYTILALLFFSNYCFSNTNLGILSLLGENANLVNVSTLSISHHNQKVLLPEWSIDKKMSGYIIVSLSELSHINSKTLNTNILSSDNIVTEKKVFSDPVLIPSAQNKLIHYGKKNAMDYLLVILPTNQSDFILPSNPISPLLPGLTKLRGYGLYYNQDFIFTYISSEAFLIDIKTGKTIQYLTLKTSKELKLKRLLSNHQKEKLYQFITDGINSKALLKKWRDKVFNFDITEDYKKILISDYESENDDEEFVDDLVSDLIVVINPKHHSYEEFTNLPKKELTKIKRHLHQDLYSQIIPEITKSIATKIKPLN